MIQRIQTLYLLLAVAALAGAVFNPWGTFFTNEGGAFSFDAFAVTQQVGEAQQNIHFWALGAVLCVCAALLLVAVFCFKKRILQARFCVFSLVALMGFYLGYLIFMLITKAQLQASFRLNFGTSLPLVAMILDMMAVRAILADEKKVRAYDRIR